MAKSLKRPLSIALGALAATTLGGCYYGDVYGASYASGGDCAARYGNAYYDYDGYAYDDGYGYDCYDASDYGGGFAQIGLDHRQHVLRTGFGQCHSRSRGDAVSVPGR